MSRQPIGIEQARAAKDDLKQLVESIEGVVGLGITKKGRDYAVKVLLDRSPGEDVPEVVMGVPVIVEIVGQPRKRKEP